MKKLLLVAAILVIFFGFERQNKMKFYESKFDEYSDSSKYYLDMAQLHSQRFDSIGSSIFWHNWQMGKNYSDSMKKYLKLIKKL